MSYLHDLSLVHVIQLLELGIVEDRIRSCIFVLLMQWHPSASPRCRGHRDRDAGKDQGRWERLGAGNDQGHWERPVTLGKTRDAGKDEGRWESLGTLGKSVLANRLDG